MSAGVAWYANMGTERDWRTAGMELDWMVSGTDWESEIRLGMKPRCVWDLVCGPVWNGCWTLWDRNLRTTKNGSK